MNVPRKSVIVPPVLDHSTRGRVNETTVTEAFSTGLHSHRFTSGDNEA